MKVISLPVVPCPKPRMVKSDKWRNRTCVLEYWAFKDALRLKAQEKKYHLQEPLYVRFYLPMPDSWSKKKKDRSKGELHRQKPDIDNLLKAFMDALLDDDSSIAVVHAEKYWADSGKIEVVLTEE